MSASCGRCQSSDRGAAHAQRRAAGRWRPEHHWSCRARGVRLCLRNGQPLRPARRQFASAARTPPHRPAFPTSSGHCSRSALRRWRIAPARCSRCSSDIAGVAACLPGVSLTATPSPEQRRRRDPRRARPDRGGVRGGAPRVERDPATLSGRIIGIGARSAQPTRQRRAKSVIACVPIDDGACDRRRTVDRLHADGMLAQVGRPGLVRDLARRLVADFAGKSRPPDVGCIARGARSRRSSAACRSSRLWGAPGSRACFGRSLPDEAGRDDGSACPRIAERRSLQCHKDQQRGIWRDDMTRALGLVPASRAGDGLVRRQRHGRRPSRSASTSRSPALSQRPAPTSSTAPRSPPTRSTPRAAFSARRSSL